MNKQTNKKILAVHKIYTGNPWNFENPSSAHSIITQQYTATWRNKKTGYSYPSSAGARGVHSNGGVTAVPWRLTAGITNNVIVNDIFKNYSYVHLHLISNTTAVVRGTSYMEQTPCWVSSTASHFLLAPQFELLNFSWTFITCPKTWSSSYNIIYTYYTYYVRICFVYSSSMIYNTYRSFCVFLNPFRTETIMLH